MRVPLPTVSSGRGAGAGRLRPRAASRRLRSTSRRPERWARRLLSLLLLVLLSSATRSFAQRIQDRPNAEVAEAAIEQLRSPYCPGFMLKICTSPQAAALRDSIYDLAGQGSSSDEIVEWMLSNHGEEWRAIPQRSGAGLWAWVIPPVVLLLGVGLVAAWLRSQRADLATAGPAPAISPSEREELARALREWEDSGEDADA